MLLTFRKKTRGGVLHFSYFGFNDGSLLPSSDSEAVHGWHERGSAGEAQSKVLAEVLSPGVTGIRIRRVETATEVCRQHLSLASAILALKAEGFEVLEVLSADRLHGYSLRLGSDLLLAARSVETSETRIIAVYFHPMVAAFVGTVDVSSESFSHTYFDYQLFDNFLDASLCESIESCLHFRSLWLGTHVIHGSLLILLKHHEKTEKTPACTAFYSIDLYGILF